jgi:hypothetical protein
MDGFQVKQSQVKQAVPTLRKGFRMGTHEPT